jgi:hypothetical protein
LIETARWNLLLHDLPAEVVAAAVILALVGLCGPGDPWIGRCALVVGGYMAALLVVGRPDNAYWGILYAPLAPMGLVFAPAALRDLFVCLIGAKPPNARASA